MNTYAKIAVVVALLAGLGGVMAYKLTHGRAPGDGCLSCSEGPVGTGRAAAPGAGGDVSAASRPAAETRPAALPRLVEFGAGMCLACKQMAPIIAQLKADYAGRLEVLSVDVSVDRAAAREAGIQRIPTQIFYAADGRELFRHQGFYPAADILAKWKELGVDLSPSRP